MVEILANSLEDTLIDGLSFKLAKTASYHIGRPRKDNLITNDITPTKAELTRRMGDGILTYTKTEDGRFIPIWSESI